MKRMIILIAVVLLAGGGYLTWQRTASQTTTTVTPTAPAVKEREPLVSEAKVVPVQHAALSLQTSGVVAAIPVKEGDRVEANQVLVRLDNGHQSARVKNAQATLEEAQTSYQNLLNG